MKYIWPLPVGIILYLTTILLLYFGGRALFLSYHFLLEIGMVVSAIASVIFTFRFLRKDGYVTKIAFWLNVCYGPLILLIILIFGLYGVIKNLLN